MATLVEIRADIDDYLRDNNIKFITPGKMRDILVKVVDFVDDSDVGSAITNGGNTFGSDMIIGTEDANDVKLKTNDSVRLTITTSGKVLINTETESSYGFDVNTTSRFSDEVTIQESGGGNMIFLPTVNNTGEHKIAFSYYQGSKNHANVIVGRRVGSNGVGNIQVWATSTNGGNADVSHIVWGFASGTYAQSSNNRNISYVPITVGDVTIEGSVSTGKYMKVRTDQPTPAQSNFTYGAGDAVYINRGGGDAILEGGGNAGNGANGHAVLRASLSTAPNGTTNSKVDVLRAKANDNIRTEMYGDVGSATSAEIIVGTGVPAITATDGSVFIRTDGGGSLYQMRSSSWVSI